MSPFDTFAKLEKIVTFFPQIYKSGKTRMKKGDLPGILFLTVQDFSAKIGVFRQPLL